MVHQARSPLPILNWPSGEAIGDLAPDQALYLGDQIRQAGEQVGVFYLRGSGVTETVIASLFATGDRFFRGEWGKKQAWVEARAVDDRLLMGYVHTDRAVQDFKDIKESLSVFPQGGSEAAHWQQIAGEGLWLGSEVQPQSQVLSDVISSYFYRCQRVVDQLLGGLALALEMPESYFRDRHGQNSNLRLLHYPALPEIPPGHTRAHPHLDYSTLTLLAQDDRGGLEVWIEEQWISVTPVPGTIVVFVGKPLQRWTNDRLRAVCHRVIVPEDERRLCSRFSAAFFCDPNRDTDLSCLPSCRGPDQPAQYPPIQAGEYIDRILAS